MKKRILSFLLAVITVFHILPWSILPVIAESGDTSAIGKQGRISLDEGVMFYMYKEMGSNGPVGYGIRIDSKTQLPETFTILDFASTSGFDYYKIGTNDGSSHAILDTYPWIRTDFVEIIEEPDDGLIRGKVDLFCDEAEGGTVTLDPGEKVYVITDLHDSIGENITYQWQMQLEDGRWANIADYFLPYATISEALLANENTLTGKSNLRCIITEEDKMYVSGALTVMTASAEENTLETATGIIPEAGSSNGAENELLPLSDEAFQIIINYEFRNETPAKHVQVDGEIAAHTFTVTIPSGGHYSGEITSPAVVGYKPYVKTTETDTSEGVIKYGKDSDDKDVYYKPAPSINFVDVTEKTVITVYYIPQMVNYVVKFYEQHLHDDEYTLSGTKIGTGFADSAVGANHDAVKTGFTALYYDPETRIDGDGTTEVEIYYDRNYYLVDFDLVTDEAFGVTPYYVRYNAQVVLPTPTRPGYTFNNWSLKKVYTVREDEDGNKVETEITDSNVTSLYQKGTAGTLLTIKHSLDYTANWKAAATTYTLVYWLENTDSTSSGYKNNYDVWYTVPISAQVGAQTITGGDHIKTYVSAQYGATPNAVSDVAELYPYLTYVADLTDKHSLTVAGDGSTAINIYYSRNSYTLKFYYAMSKGDQWYVIGGSSNYFGSLADPSIADDEIRLLDQYLEKANPISQVGEVSEPTLNEKGTARNYTMGTETSKADSSYRHHYISFTAKYGADITDLWPCDVFNSVTNKEKNTSNPSNGWKGTTAYVSAWNGEYYVKYTQDNKGGNQTVKGNYTQLDENLLWASTYGTSDTVAYACFWENGAEGVSWNDPNLFRYKIWLPLLTGQSTTGLTTKEYDGTTYYLAENYDTCDDSNVGSQTQPALVGFTKNGSSSATLTKGTDYDGAVYKEGYEVNYYYSRIIYNLSYDDHYGSTVSLPVPYGTSLNSDTYRDADGPAYPVAFESGAYEFDGWFIDEACQIPFEFNTTMPAKNIQLFAKWEHLTYSASVYLDKDKAEVGTDPLYSAVVVFGTLLNESEPDHKNTEHGDYIFAGWYYIENEEEKRFDFNTMPIKRDIVIYAKWTSHIPVRYTVKYILGDETGNPVTDELHNFIEVAESTEGLSLAGKSKPFAAKVGFELKEEYQIGFFPLVRSHSMQMSISAEDNVYSFIYLQPPKTLRHTVTHEFYSKDFIPILGTNHLEEVFVHQFSPEQAQTMNAELTVDFREGITKANIVIAANDHLKLHGMPLLTSEQEEKIWEIVVSLSPDYFKQTITLETGEKADNNIVFNWQSREAVGLYQVIHYFQTLDGKAYIAEYTQEFAGNYDTEVTATPMERYGFDKVLLDGLSKESGKIEKVTDANGNGKIDENEGGLVLNVYYDRIKYDYTVHYYQVGTTTKLAENATVTGVPFGTVITIGTGDAELNKQIDGYTLQNGGVTHEIAGNGQGVICYYEGLDVDYRYQEMINGRGILTSYSETVKIGESAPIGAVPTANSGYRFAGWYYKDENGDYQAVTNAQATVDASTGMISPVSPTAEYADTTIVFYAKFLPTTLLIENKNASANEAYVYTIKGVAGTETENIDLDFVIVGNGSITLAEIPSGNYTVTLNDNWSWRYNGTISQNVDFSDNITVEFDYSNQTMTDQWLSADANGVYTGGSN